MSKSLSEKDKARLQKIFESFDITALEREGGFAVISASEPAFCFERDTLEEIDKLVNDSLSSYLRLFHDLDVRVEAEREPIKESPVPVAKLKTLSRVRPSYRNHGSEAVASV